MAMTDEWVPLSVREGWIERTEYDALHDGVPEWLRESLEMWTRGRILLSGGNVAENLREVERRLKQRLDWSRGNESALKDLFSWAESFPEQSLSAVDLLLGKVSIYDDDDARRLEGMLREGGSAWQVVQSNEAFCLERRVEEGVRATAERAMEGRDSAAYHLRDAWHAAYGREPNPSEAYRLAVKAVEAAALSVVTPDDPRTTLGKMIVAMRDAPEKWSFAITSTGPDGLETVRHLMEVVWTGQHDRHGKHDPEGPVEMRPEEAEAAVHTAATLVHWFRSGAIRRMSNE